MAAAPGSARRPAISGLDVHVGAVIVSGFIGIVLAVSAMVTTPPPLNTLVFAALGLVAGACAVKIPGVNALVSASDTFFIASAMLFGPAPAMVALALDSTGLAWRRGYNLRRLLFNAAQPALSLGLATWAFQLVGGSPLDQSTHIAATILPLTVLTAVYFGLNSGLLAIAGVERRRRAGTHRRRRTANRAADTRSERAAYGDGRCARSPCRVQPLANPKSQIPNPDPGSRIVVP